MYYNKEMESKSAKKAIQGERRLKTTKNTSFLRTKRGAQYYLVHLMLPVLKNYVPMCPIIMNI